MNIILSVRAEKFVEYLLDQTWHHECEIFFDTDERLKIKYPNDHADVFLRFSKGPAQGYFWDIYGEDFQNIELAIIALSKAPIPLNYRKAEYPIQIKFPIKGAKR